MRSPTLLDDFDVRQRSSVCGSQSGCHTGSISIVLKVIHRPSTDAIRKQNKAALAGRLLCLEDGKKLKMLKRHLATSYGLTPDGYREKWGLPRDYPMVAPSYANTRSSLAKSIGLGRKRSEISIATPDGPDDDAVPDFAQEPDDTAPVTRVKEGQRGKRKRMAES